jgi:hypothetical protein
MPSAVTDSYQNERPFLDLSRATLTLELYETTAETTHHRRPCSIKFGNIQ